jgi:hypothetical protein
MRDPINLIQPVFDSDNISYLKLNQIPDYDIPDYNLSDDKEFQRYILDIKKVCRGSFEYQTLIQFLKENLDMNKCSFYEQVINAESSNIKIHIHHDPFCIEDIIWIVVRKRQTMMEPLDVELVAEEVIKLHYQLKVGLIPLSETVHELVHNQYIFIPTTHVMGKYREFANEYEAFISPDQLDVLNRIEEYTKVWNSSDAYKFLDKHYIYVDTSGAWNLPTKQEIINMMKEIITKESNGSFN